MLLCIGEWYIACYVVILLSTLPAATAAADDDGGGGEHCLKLHLQLQL